MNRKQVEDAYFLIKDENLYVNYLNVLSAKKGETCEVLVYSTPNTFTFQTKNRQHTIELVKKHLEKIRRELADLGVL